METNAKNIAALAFTTTYGNLINSLIVNKTRQRMPKDLVARALGGVDKDLGKAIAAASNYSILANAFSIDHETPLNTVQGPVITNFGIGISGTDKVYVIAFNGAPYGVSGQAAGVLGMPGMPGAHKMYQTHGDAAAAIFEELIISLLVPTQLEDIGFDESYLKEAAAKEKEEQEKAAPWLALGRTLFIELDLIEELRFLADSCADSTGTNGNDIIKRIEDVCEGVKVTLEELLKLPMVDTATEFDFKNALGFAAVVMRSLDMLKGKTLKDKPTRNMIASNINFTRESLRHALPAIVDLLKRVSAAKESKSEQEDWATFGRDYFAKVMNEMELNSIQAVISAIDSVPRAQFLPLVKNTAVLFRKVSKSLEQLLSASQTCPPPVAEMERHFKAAAKALEGLPKLARIHKEDRQGVISALQNVATDLQNNECVGVVAIAFSTHAVV